MDYLKEVKGIEKIGVHGESLGGMVASHLGRYTNVDFVFADRTFSSLYKVAHTIAGKWGIWIMKVVACWGTPAGCMGEDFLYTKCYKVLGSDPKDTIIHENASLKSGVSYSLVKSLVLIVIDWCWNQQFLEKEKIHHRLE